MSSNDGKTVMIVEDDLHIRDVMKDALEFEGFKVITASHGKEALLLLKQHNNIGLIVLDLLMPVMNGKEFLHHFHQLPKEELLPVMVMSATPDALGEAQVAKVLRKPVDLDHFIESVREQLRA